ncbi:MAG: hypothetical protein RLZZ254_886, partial [Actinomycetota bacterium]
EVDPSMVELDVEGESVLTVDGHSGGAEGN